MTYRVLCTFHPGIGMFGSKRGAWRVLACEETVSRSAVRRPVIVLRTAEPKILIVSSTRRRQSNSWCSPRKILAEWLQARAEVRAALAACRAWGTEPV